MLGSHTRPSPRSREPGLVLEPVFVILSASWGSASSRRREHPRHAGIASVPEHEHRSPATREAHPPVWIELRLARSDACCLALAVARDLPRAPAARDARDQLGGVRYHLPVS